MLNEADGFCPLDLPNVVRQAATPRLLGFFERQVRLNGGQTAVESPGVNLTYAELHARSVRLAHVLVRAGVTRGDRICILSENDPDFLVLAIVESQGNRIGSLGEGSGECQAEKGEGQASAQGISKRHSQGSSLSHCKILQQ
jgi:hypothetical protein